MTPGIWVSLLGQVVGVIGAGYLAANPFLSKQAAVELGVARWAGGTDEENLKLPLVKELLRQSSRSRIGLGLVAGGFLLQAVATVMSNV